MWRIPLTEYKHDSPFTIDSRLVGTVRVSVNFRSSSSLVLCILRQWRRMLRRELKSWPHRQHEIVTSSTWTVEKLTIASKTDCRLDVRHLTPLVDPSSSGGGGSSLDSASSASHFFRPWLCVGLSGPRGWAVWSFSASPVSPSHATGLSLALLGGRRGGWKTW